MRLSAIALSKIRNDIHMSFLILARFMFRKYEPGLTVFECSVIKALCIALCENITISLFAKSEDLVNKPLLNILERIY
jgi:hypothetical protein